MKKHKDKHRKHRHKQRPQKQQKSNDRARPDDPIKINEFLFRQGQKAIAAEIVHFLTEKDARFRSVDLAKQLGYDSSSDLPGFWYVLHRLQEDGTVDKDSDRCYGIPSADTISYTDPITKEPSYKLEAQNQYKENEVYVGRISTHPNGYGFVSVDNYDDDIFVPAGELEFVIHQDLVEVMVTNVPSTYSGKKTPHERCEGAIKKLVERPLKEIVGVIRRRNRKFELIADNSRILPEITIKLKDAQNAKDGDKVVVHELEFMESSKIQARVKEILGQAGDSNVEVTSIVRSMGIDETFPDSVLEETSGISGEITDEELASRTDMRQKITFTIDPFDAKDFDDALSLEVMEDGNYQVGIHIADVSHYVTENTRLDEEAFKRSTSVYLVDRVIPMLPSKLSENICSLVPNKDRLAYSVMAKLSEDGQVLDYSIQKTVINSKRRFTYEEAHKIIAEGSGEFCYELQKLNELSLKVHDERFKVGGLDFDTDEIKFRLDENGKPIELVKKIRLDSHRLIEEFMLLANKLVASHISTHFQTEKLAYPSVYRVHDTPKQERIVLLADFVRRLGFQIELKRNGKNNAIVSSFALRELLKQVHGTNYEFLVNEIAIRSMAKAIYSPQNIGHFGLGFSNYTHFTSPIRRYPDLIIHRLLFEYEERRKLKRKVLKKRLGKLNVLVPEMCEHASLQEQNAVEAERNSIKFKQAEYMADRIGEKFKGIISGVTEFGLYVRLIDTGVEGLVHIKNLQDDYYEFDEQTYSLVGKRKHRRFQMSSFLMVSVSHVDLRKRTIDLEIL
jgi:ribonuclease R